jgi:regulator of protease activity HflC (stomatin/prohibitin superfamily)
MDFPTGLSALIWGLTSLYVLLKVARSIRIVPNRTELLVERLGSYDRTLGPGVHFLIPFLDKVSFEIDLKEEAIDVPPQDCFTKDNVRVEVDGVLYMRVTSSKMASYGIVEYRFAIIQLAQTMVRSVIGQLDLDHTFEERDLINSRVISALNEIGRTWGVMVSRYEVKNIVPPPSVRDAMERQMGSERDRRALMARAEGEKQARINDADGKKQEMINRSQGEMQRRINEAEGKAEEIIAIAKATADSIRVVAETVTQAGGREAVNMRLGQQLITKMGSLAAGQRVVLPADLTKVDDLIKGIGLDIDAKSAVPRASVPRPPAQVPVAVSNRAEALPRMPTIDMLSPPPGGRSGD